MRTRPKACDAYWRVLREEIGCCVCGRVGDGVQIHHCHGGSIADLGIRRALGAKTSDWLVIPLWWEYHTGTEGIDGGMGVREWERRHGKQTEHLAWLKGRTGIDALALALGPPA